MKKYFTESDYANGYCSLNIEIPDKELVESLISEINIRLNDTLTSRNTTEEQRKFLKEALHFATSKEDALDIFIQARKKGDAHCVVVSFNATLPQKKYDELGVVNFKYLCWTKKAWKKAKEIYGVPIVKKLIDCLISELLRVACQVLKRVLGITL